MRSTLSFPVLVALCAAMLPNTSHGESSSEVARHSVEFSLSVGYGRLETPVALHGDFEFYLLPQLAWYGDRFYFENGLFGYALQESSAEQLDLVLYPNEDGLLFQASDRFLRLLGEPSLFPIDDRITVLEPPERRLSAMAGLRYASQWQSLQWTAMAGIDVSGVHDGWELTFTIAQPEVFQFGAFQLGAKVGLSLKSAELVDYYYMPQNGEIRPAEGDQYLVNETDWVTVGPFGGELGFRVNAQIQARYTLSERFALVGYYHHHWLSDALTDTPLIISSHHAGYFAGLQYQF